MSLFTLYSQFPKYHLLFFISNSHCFYNTQMVLLCHDSRCFIKTCSADTKDWEIYRQGHFDDPGYASNGTSETTHDDVF